MHSGQRAYTPGTFKFLPGRSDAPVTYVLLAKKGPRLTASRRAWIARLNGSAPLYRKDSSRFGWNKETGAVMLSAIAHAEQLAGTPWLFFGDDDTHVDVESIEAFARATPPSDSVVFGNIYDSRINFDGCYRGSGAERTFPLVGGWFTGGTGVLVPALVAKRLTKEKVARWAEAGRHCKCIDQPFGCALHDLGVRLVHRPNLFLDSCLDCLAIPRERRRILSCHAVTAFRRKNFGSRHKGSLDEEIMRLEWTHFRFRRDPRAKASRARAGAPTPPHPTLHPSPSTLPPD